MRNRDPWKEDGGSGRGTRVAIGLTMAVAIATAAYIGYLLLTGGVTQVTNHS